MKQNVIIGLTSLIWSFLIMMPADRADAQKFKKVINGLANFIFASKEIPKNKEHTITLKNYFTINDKIYARGYFPRPVGAFRPGEEFNTDLWIDGKFNRRINWKQPPQPRWKQMQLWILNTGQDDLGMKYFRGLSPGKHTITVKFMRTKFMKYKVVIKNGKKVKEPVYRPVFLTTGSFKLAVP